MAEVAEKKPRRRRRGDNPVRLTPRQSLFLDYLLTGLPYAEAYLKAGYKAKPQNARSRAAETLRIDYVAEEYERRQKERRERLFRKIESECDKSIDTVTEIRDTSDLDPTRLSAAKDILDRGGIKQAERHEITSKSLIVVVTED